jgi:nucleosome assembly protein 1-like 1
VYYLINDPEAGHDDVLYDRAEGCEIKWKDGKDLSVTIETKKQRHKSSNKTRVVKKTVPAETFFSFFAPPQIPEEDDEEDEEIDPELNEKLEADYEIGEFIKEKLIPHAIDWFTGKAVEYEGEDEVSR